MAAVAAFTDTYRPTVNGVTYTITAWRERWRRDGGRMDVVYPAADGYVPEDGEHPVRSLPFPFYEGFRLGLPRVPPSVRDVELVHAHTPFSIGVAGLRLARRLGVPAVASYHTPTGEYTDYLAPTDGAARWLRRVTERYERWFLDRMDLVLAPSEATREHLVTAIGVDAPVEVVPNGVDVDRFKPVATEGFCAAHGLEVDRPLVGYTGRHGYEKRLSDLLEATADLDVTVVFGGDGPARAALERRAAELDVDARFLGFLDRADLPRFYSALDVFGFPSPVETQGLVALEAMACGTPVVGADAGALAGTIDADLTGYRYPTGDTDAFRSAIERALSARDRLRENCLDRRPAMSVDRTVDRLATVYERVR